MRDFNEWWHIFKVRGKLNFINNVSISMVILFLVLVIVMVLIKRDISKLLNIKNIVLIILVSIILALLGDFIGNALWERYDKINVIINQSQNKNN